MQPRKTIRQHLLTGTVPQGKPERPSNFVAGRPKLPAHLSPAAKAEYKRCVKLLEQRGTVTAGDYATLAVYATVYARWVAVKQEIGDDYMVITTTLDSHGRPVQVKRINPLLKVCGECESRLLTLVKSLGLTPDSRERVKPTNANPANEVVPGSMADLMPELLSGNVHRPMLVPIAPEDITFEEDEPQEEEQPA